MKWIFSLYVLCAVITSFTVLAFCGYAIAHGGGALILLFPACLALFLVPLWIVIRKRREKPRITLILLLPLLLLGSPALYYIALKPVMERIYATRELNRLTIDTPTEAVILEKDSVPLALEISYIMHVPEDAGDFFASGSFLPETSLSPPGVTHDYLFEGTTKSTELDGQPFVPYRDVPRPGNYKITMVFSPQDLDFKNGRWCRSPHYLKQESLDYRTRIYAAPPSSLQLNLSWRVSLSRRMGFFDKDYQPLPLQTHVSPAEIRARVDTFPVCSE